MLEWLLLSAGLDPATVTQIMVWAGCAIILGVIYLLIKRVETRLLLIGAGFLMCFLTKNPMEAFNSFGNGMVLATLIKTILSVMGFAYVMKLTKCDAHHVHLSVGGLSALRPIIIPAAVLVTAFINISLSSAAGCSAAVGAILIPLLMSLGIHPAIAASAVMAGTYGSMLSPGLSHNGFIAEMLKVSAMDVIAVHYWTSIVCVLIGAVSLAVVAIIRKENKGYVTEDAQEQAKMEKVNVLYALVPIVPVVLLIFSAYISGKGAPEWGKALIADVPALKGVPVPTAMLIGTILGILVTRANPTNCVKEFFKGMGDSYASVMGIIIAAGVFVAGMKSMGLVDAFIAVLKETTAIAQWGATFGPFALAIITGSGDAATLAFNGAVAPHAPEFGMEVANVASLATITGALGRTMSPLAGAAIICAGLANVNPMEIAKRNAPGMIIAAFVAMFMLV